MPVPRRDFMKLLGISLGSVLLARCQRKPTSTPTSDYVVCYEITAIRPDITPETPTPESVGLRDRMRLLWLRFGELAAETRDGSNSGGTGAGDNPLGGQMIREHRAVLDEMVAAGVLTDPVADLIQEAYAAAVYHVWRSNAPITCYEPMMVDYAPASAENVVRQADALGQIAAGSTVAPETIEKVQAALEHDLAYYALSYEDVQALYDRLIEEHRDSGEAIPTYEDLELSLTPDVKAAAQFLVDVLMGK
ncbi:MAG: hypothetical protein ACK2UB_13370 [Anaerolineales bacterium]